MELHRLSEQHQTVTTEAKHYLDQSQSLALQRDKWQAEAEVGCGARQGLFKCPSPPPGRDPASA